MGRSDVRLLAVGASGYIAIEAERQRREWGEVGGEFEHCLLMVGHRGVSNVMILRGCIGGR